MTSSSPASVLAWEDDPGEPPDPRRPVSRPGPDLNKQPLPVGIDDAAPADNADRAGTADFRYWAAAEAMRRAADFWGAVVPGGTAWNAAVGPALRAKLDAGDDLNAYYDRKFLNFFHHSSGDLVVYSGESPDVVCHELGHAVLDALRPQLWDAASAEVAAFHESFADISALLSALQLESVRERVLAETHGVLSRSSSLSRLAEQLGWAIRQVSPHAVDAHCLRNAANRFFYQDPVDLPPSAPANHLSSEVHSFSRVFTGAYLRVLAGIFRNTGKTEADLSDAAQIAGRLLVSAVAQAPVTSGYYAQVAAHVIAADAALTDAKFAGPIRAAFVRHGILSPAAAAGLTSNVLAPHLAGIAAFDAASGTRALSDLEIDGGRLGIDGAVTVSAPSESPRFAVAGAAFAGASVAPSAAARVAEGFVEDLIRRGRVQVSTDEEHAAAHGEHRLATHVIEQSGSKRRLVRRLFD